MKNLKSKILIIGLLAISFLIGIGNAKASNNTNILEIWNLNDGLGLGQVDTNRSFPINSQITDKWGNNGANIDTLAYNIGNPVNLTNNFSVSFLIKGTASFQQRIILRDMTSGSEWKIFDSTVQTAGVSLDTIGNQTPNIITTDSTAAATMGNANWNLITYSFTNTEIKVYINSNLYRIATFSNINWSNVNFTQLYEYGGGYYTDDFIIWNHALSANEVKTLSETTTEPDQYFSFIPPSGSISSINELYTPNLTVDTKKGWEIPYLWTACSNFSNINKATIKWLPDNATTTSYYNTVVQDKTVFVGPQQCSGQGELTEPFNNNLPSNGTGTLEMTLTHTDGTIENIDKILTYSANSYNYWVGSSSLIPNLNFNPSNQSTTTPILITWSLNANLWASSTLELYNLTDNTITATTTPTSAFGADYLNIPTPTQDESKQYQFIGIMSDGTELKSNKFLINFTTITNTTNNIFGTSTAAIVCSPSEWNTPNPVFNWGFGTSTVPAFNFTKLRCNILASGLNIGLKISKIPVAVLNTTGKLLSNMFPFNLPIGVLTSWKNSNNQNIPSDLEFLTPEDSEGNLTLTIPESIGGTTSTIKILGPTVFANNTQLNNMFNNIKNLSTYLIWLGLLAEIFYMGKNIISDLGNDETENIGNTTAAKNYNKEHKK